MIVSSPHNDQHTDGLVRSMWLAYGADSTASQNNEGSKISNGMQLQIILGQRELSISLVIAALHGQGDREHFQRQMIDPEFRKQLLKLLGDLGTGYWIEIACERKAIDHFQSEDELWEFVKADQWMYYDFLIARSYSPDAMEIGHENIAATTVKESAKLMPLLRHIKSQ